MKEYAKWSPIPKYADELIGMTKAELEAVAVELGIKKDGVGWSVCCPAKGLEHDIMAAILHRGV